MQDVELAKATLLEGLNNAEDETEMKIYLLSLKNAQLEETIPVLLQYAAEHTGVVCSTALSALQGFPAEILSTEVQGACFFTYNVYMSGKFWLFCFS